MLLSWLLACGPPDAPAPDEGPGPGWTLGEVAACDAGGPPTWTEDPTPPETYAAGTHQGQEPGAVGIVPVDGEPWLVWSPPSAGPRARPLAGGAVREIVAESAFGLAQADLDHDGAVDLLLLGQPFTIVWAFGTPDEEHTPFVGRASPVRDAAVADIDGDGWEDLVLGFSNPDHADIEALRGEIWPNLGGRAFGDAVRLPGDADVWGPSFDLTVFDAGDDGVPDVYLCNDFGRTAAPNVVLANTGGTLAPADGDGLDVRTSCMGTAFGDIGGDGHVDAIVASTPTSFLLEASADGWYDSGAARSLPIVPFPHMGWGAVVEDPDNDGYPDVVMGVSEFYGEAMTPIPVGWYRQGEDGTFEDAGAAAGFPQEAHSRGVVARDLDDDGVPEVIFGDALRSPWVFWSDGCSAGAWLDVDAPHGSHVVVRAGGKAWAAQVTTDSGWASTGPARAHIGLGDIDEVDAVEITPPWGDTEVLPGPIATRRVVTWRPG